MSHVKYRRALVENLVGDVRNPIKKSHQGSAVREARLNTALHFLYHYEKKKHKDCIVCSNRKVMGARKETYFDCKTCTINWPCVLGNVLKDITLSRTSKSFSVGPIVYRV
jgi:hypothetical protein